MSKTRTVEVDGTKFEVGVVTLAQAIALANCFDSWKGLVALPGQQPDWSKAGSALLAQPSAAPMQDLAEAIAVIAGVDASIVQAWPLAKTIRIATEIGKAFVDVNAGYLSEVSSALEGLTAFGNGLAKALQGKAPSAALPTEPSQR